MISIVLVDDHHIVRQGLKSLLEAEGDLHILGEAGDGLQAIELVERVHPDVVISDVMMPRLNGLEMARQLHQLTPETRIILLSMHSSEEYVLEALRAGVSGYVLKDSFAADLTQAVRKVASGGRYLSAPLSERALDAYARSAQDTHFDLYDTLTNRERTILQLAAEGYSSTDIATNLTISARTVETHRGNLMHKLGLHSQTDLVRYAMKRGILPSD